MFYSRRKPQTTSLMTYCENSWRMRLNTKPMTPAKVGVILLLVQLLVPQVVYYYHSSYQDRLYLSLIGFLVGFSYSSDEGFRFALNTISGIGYSFLFLGLGFIFVYQVFNQPVYLFKSANHILRSAMGTDTCHSQLA